MESSPPRGRVSSSFLNVSVIRCSVCDVHGVRASRLIVPMCLLRSNESQLHELACCARCRGPNPSRCACQCQRKMDLRSLVILV